VTIDLIRRAARAEFAKLARPMDESHFRQREAAGVSA
jgi:hypothetical protein